MVQLCGEHMDVGFKSFKLLHMLSPKGTQSQKDVYTQSICFLAASVGMKKRTACTFHHQQVVQMVVNGKKRQCKSGGNANSCTS
jgi:hypothetical protein